MTREQEQLVLDNLDLVGKIAHLPTPWPQDRDDIEGEATVGLLRAAQSYRNGNGASFRTYAVHIMRGYIRHYFRDRVAMIRIPACFQERGNRRTDIPTCVSADDPQWSDAVQRVGVGDCAEMIVNRLGDAQRIAEVMRRTRLTTLEREGLIARMASRPGRSKRIFEAGQLAVEKLRTEVVR